MELQGVGGVQGAMQGAEKINGEFEVGFDEHFEQSWVKAEWVGHMVMFAFVAAGLAGVFGRGPLSHRTEKSAGSALAVDFEPIARSQAPTQVTLHIDNPTDSPEMDLFIGSNSVEPMGLQRIQPQPVAMKAVQDGITLTLAVPPHTHGAEVRLNFEPSALGENQLIAQLEGHDPIRWSQFILP